MTFYNFCKKLLQKTILRMWKVEIINPENEPSEGALVCANHISNIDPVIICASLKNQIRFMAKKELFSIPILGSMLKAFGSFPVNRGSVDMTAMKTALNLLEHNNYVGMFPQGTRCSGIEPKDSKVKGGVGMILSRVETDILPIAIITKGNKFKLGNKVYVVLGEVIKYSEIEFTEKKREEFDRISKLIFERICNIHEQYAYLKEDKEKSK